jgi:hypothetical protein
VLRALYYDTPCACRGVLQARRESRLVLQVPEVLIEASANIVVQAESVQVCAVRRPPYGQGIAPPFIGQGGGNLHRAALFHLRVEV